MLNGIYHVFCIFSLRTMVPPVNAQQLYTSRQEAQPSRLDILYSIPINLSLLLSNSKLKVTSSIFSIYDIYIYISIHSMNVQLICTINRGLLTSMWDSFTSASKHKNTDNCSICKRVKLSRGLQPHWIHMCWLIRLIDRCLFNILEIMIMIFKI